LTYKGFLFADAGRGGKSLDYVKMGPVLLTAKTGMQEIWQLFWKLSNLTPPDFLCLLNWFFQMLRSASGSNNKNRSVNVFIGSRLNNFC